MDGAGVSGAVAAGAVAAAADSVWEAKSCQMESSMPGSGRGCSKGGGVEMERDDLM